MESYEKEEGERMLLLAFMWYSAHELDSSAERVQSIKKGRAFSVEAAVTYPKTLLCSSSCPLALHLVKAFGAL